jgi:hypothetical protein
VDADGVLAASLLRSDNVTASVALSCARFKTHSRLIMRGRLITEFGDAIATLIVFDARGCVFCMFGVAAFSQIISSFIIFDAFVPL